LINTEGKGSVLSNPENSIEEEITRINSYPGYKERIAQGGVFAIEIKTSFSPW
jgi:hypothetical protein